MDRPRSNILKYILDPSVSLQCIVFWLQILKLLYIKLRDRATVQTNQNRDAPWGAFHAHLWAVARGGSAPRSMRSALPCGRCDWPHYPGGTKLLVPCPIHVHTSIISLMSAHPFERRRY